MIIMNRWNGEYYMHIPQSFIDLKNMTDLWLKLEGLATVI